MMRAAPAGRLTVHGKDAFSLVFELGTGPERSAASPAISPRGSQSTEAALAELTERHLLDLFHQSQPAWTSPEGMYGALWGVTTNCSNYAVFWASVVVTRTPKIDRES